MQVAAAAYAGGFDGIVVPHDPAGVESWVTAAALARDVPHVTVVAEFPPSFGTSVYAVKMASTFQRFSGGRLAWQLALGGTTGARHSAGDFVHREDEIERATEFLQTAKGLWYDAPYTYRGQFFEVENGGLVDPLTKYPAPPVFLSGDSTELLQLSAEYADVHVFETTSLEDLSFLVAQLAGLATRHERRVRAGLALPVESRDGDFQGLATALDRYVSVGIETFVLEGTPHLEEAYSVSERVLPLVSHLARDGQPAVAV